MINFTIMFRIKGKFALAYNNQVYPFSGKHSSIDIGKIIKDLLNYLN